MADIIYSVLTFEGEDFSMRRLKRKYFNLFGRIDFNKVIPTGKNDDCYLLWGSPSNALGTYVIDGRSIRIQTEWSVPKPTFAELSRQMPDVYIGVEWADSNDIYGGNNGRYVLHGGDDITRVWQPPRPPIGRLDLLNEFAQHVCWGASFEYDDMIRIYGLDMNN
jgi:hypothetical protein